MQIHFCSTGCGRENYRLISFLFMLTGLLPVVKKIRGAWSTPTYFTIVDPPPSNPLRAWVIHSVPGVWQKTPSSLCINEGNFPPWQSHGPRHT